MDNKSLYSFSNFWVIFSHVNPFTLLYPNLLYFFLSLLSLINNFNFFLKSSRLFSSNNKPQLLITQGNGPESELITGVF